MSTNPPETRRDLGAKFDDTGPVPKRFHLDRFVRLLMTGLKFVECEPPETKRDRGAGRAGEDRRLGARGRGGGRMGSLRLRKATGVPASFFFFPSNASIFKKYHH